MNNIISYLEERKDYLRLSGLASALANNCEMKNIEALSVFAEEYLTSVSKYSESEADKKLIESYERVLDYAIDIYLDI